MSAHLHPPNRKRSMCEVIIAWHYTTGLKLPLIRESGCLRPTDAYIEPGERPVLWWSTNPYWEPTSAKVTGQSFKEVITSGNPRLACRRWMQETAELGEGLYRFGLPVRELIRWPEIGKRAGIRAWMRNSLMKTGRLQGADPAQWYGTFDAVPIDGLLFQQLVDFRYWAGKERLEHRDNQLAEIAKLNIAVSETPLAELRRIAGDDRACVNYARHKLTLYHKLLERYDAGDRAVLAAIRIKIFRAIAVAYPELAPECDRQLAERL
jgi:hypothetical protein